MNSDQKLLTSAFFSCSRSLSAINAITLQGGPWANENLVIRIAEFSVKYSKVFEGNTYIRSAGSESKDGVKGVSANSGGIKLDAETIARYLGDETGTVITQNPIHK